MLWFDTQAEEAAKFYVSIFKNSKIKTITHYGVEPPGKKGQVMTVDFELDGQTFTALNGGPQFKFTEAISLVINCDTQEEIDYYWEKLTADGGEEVQCGWLTDKHGLSWQVTPAKFLHGMGQGPRRIAASDARGDADGEAGPGDAEESVRRKMTFDPPRRAGCVTNRRADYRSAIRGISPSSVRWSPAKRKRR
jgi:predicted 3-demethylubiquinone-9 3-methyltransferase (glyoxalase superfamily)